MYDYIELLKFINMKSKLNFIQLNIRNFGERNKAGFLKFQIFQIKLKAIKNKINK